MSTCIYLCDIYETCHKMCMCIIYFKSEYIDLSLPFIDLKKVSILIGGLILFTNVNKR